MLDAVDRKRVCLTFKTPFSTPFLFWLHGIRLFGGAVAGFIPCGIGTCRKCSFIIPTDTSTTWKENSKTHIVRTPIYFGDFLLLSSWHSETNSFSFFINEFEMKTHKFVVIWIYWGNKFFFCKMKKLRYQCTEKSQQIRCNCSENRTIFTSLFVCLFAVVFCVNRNIVSNVLPLLRFVFHLKS